jgi:OOP family OmpA-OmpF porin
MIMRIYIVIPTLVLLAGCAGLGSNIAELRTKSVGGDTFAQALAAEYLAYAEARAEEGHPLRANYFAGKGLDSLAGKPVDLEKKPELEESRRSLLAVLTPDVEEVAPAKAARAQLMFDCWVEKEGVCKEGFAGALTDLQFIADALVHGEDNHFTVPFAAGSSALDAQGGAILDVISNRVAGLGEYQVEAVPADIKNRMTAPRLLTIEKGLIKRGVDAGRIHTHRKGKNKEVALSSDDHKHNANNVMISIQTYGEPKESITP